MLAPHGAVYTRQTVLGVVSEEGKQKLGDRYHDHCRCLGIEVSKAHMDAQLPLVNKELSDLWQQHVGIKTHPGITADRQQEKWKTLITNLKQQAAAKHQPAPEAAVKEKPRRLRIPELDFETFPHIPGLKTPTYSKGAKNIYAGEPLPDLTHMPGHVLYGWKDRDLLSYLEKQGITFKDGQFFDKDGNLIDKDKGVFSEVDVSNRNQHTPETKAGHWNNGKQKGATLFPDWMSQKQIMDAVVATIEDPDMYKSPENKPRRTVRKTVYFYVDGEKSQSLLKLSGTTKKASQLSCLLTQFTVMM